MCRLLNRRHVLRLFAMGVSTPWAVQATTPDPLERAALQTPRAAGAVMLGIARAGARLVAVGERGVVLLSDDGGKAWRQAAVPVSTTLVAVQFVTPALGLAVGHAGVVLRTRDHGQTWQRLLDGRRVAELVLADASAHSEDTPQAKARVANAQRLVTDGADKPWLALHMVDALQVWVLGAYGLLMKTVDGGETWQPCGHRLDNPRGLHLNAVAVQGKTMFIAGEGGLLWRSDDGGENFVSLRSPYQGSWFAAAALPSGRLVVAGLRGNGFVSDDRGASFVRSTLPTPVTVSMLLPLRDGRLLALTQAGDAAISADQGSSFKPLPLPPGAPLTDLIESDDGALVGTTLRGPRRVTALGPASSR